jgi:hypothetical protein
MSISGHDMSTEERKRQVILPQKARSAYERTSKTRDRTIRGMDIAASISFSCDVSTAHSLKTGLPERIHTITVSWLDY